MAVLGIIGIVISIAVLGHMKPTGRMTQGNTGMSV